MHQQQGEAALTGIERQIEHLDVGLFRHVNGQTTAADRRALLSLQQIVRNRHHPYVYLEIGSFMGGSLQPHLVDSRCELIYSIDPRPRQAIPDERAGEVVQYFASTQAMLDGLATIPNGDVTKIVTIEKDARHMTPADTPRVCHLCFIDGEHTNSAVLSDFRACLPRTASTGVIAFHDCFLVSSGILACAQATVDAMRPFTPLHFPGSHVFAFAMGGDVASLQRFDAAGWRRGLEPMRLKAIKEYVKRFLPRSVVRALEG